MTASPDAALLQKLDAAELRIGMAEDNKLAKLLDPALCNILNFLASPSAAVKQKAMAILSHLNKRLKADPSITLPLAGLIKLFTTASTNAMVSNFALVYIDMGLPRVSTAERSSLVPSLLVGVARRPAAQQDQLLPLLLASLPSIPLPKTKAELSGATAALPFLNDAADRALILAWLLDLLLYLPPLASAPHVPPPGLSRAAAKRVCGKLDASEVRGELLAAKKLAALRLIGGETRDGGTIFASSETLPHWVVASCDNDHAVSSQADGALRRLQAADLEQLPLVDGLTALVLGTTAQPAASSASSSSPPKQEDPLTQRSAAAVAVRLKAIQYLTKSQAACNRFPGTLQAIFSALFGTDATPKLQIAGTQLAKWTCQHSAGNLLNAVGGHLLAGMLKVLRGEAASELPHAHPDAVLMRSSAYATLASLCQRSPEHVRADTRLPAELFSALESEQLAARSNLQEALAALAEVHARKSGPSAKPPPAGMLSALRSLLLRASASASSHHARYCAMVWVATAFERTDLTTRYACLMLMADTRSEVAEASARALRPIKGKTHDAVADVSAEGAALIAGQRVTHTEKSSGIVRLGSIAAVHMDDAGESGSVEPYYTISLEDGSERSVEGTSLKGLPTGWPSLAAIAAVVTTRTELHPPPEAIPGGGVFTSGGEATEAAAVAATASDLLTASAPPIPITCLPEVLKYVVDCMSVEASALAAHRRGGEPASDTDAVADADEADEEENAEPDKLPALVVSMADLSAYLQEELEDSPTAKKRGVAELLSLLLACLTANQAPADLLRAAATTTLRLLRASPDLVGLRLRPSLPKLQSLMLSRPPNEESTQLKLCRILALAAGSATAPKLIGQLLPLLPDGENLTGCHGLEEQRTVVGAALGLGHIGAALTKAEPGESTAKLLTPVALRLSNLTRHETLAVATAAASALGHLGSAAPLPMPDGSVATEESDDKGKDEAKAGDKRKDDADETKEGEEKKEESSGPKPPPAVPCATTPPLTKVDAAYGMLHLLSHLKAKHQVVSALGLLLSGEPHGPFRNLILAYLFGLASTKDVDLHLKVGEAIARIGSAEAGTADAAAKASALPPLPPIKPPRKAGAAVEATAAAAALAAAAESAAAAEAANAGGPLLTYLLRKILEQYLVAWAPLVRQAACAWVLSMLRFAGDAKAMRSAAPAVQRGLVALLADSQEATQELAARALSTLFEKCDEATQDTIVKELVSSLATTRTANAAASGGDMSTYAELSDIANNAGQPELVYKLMELSTASAVWNTRKGVALALAGQSRDRLDAHLDKLLPTLYRYTFDPNEKIAHAMKQVWSSLVPEPKKSLTEHLPKVLAHLMEGLVDRLWRAREASCYALSEVLSGRTYDEIKDVLCDLHEKLMRAVDDIKESVRKGALGAWRAVSSVINRLCDGTLAPATQAGEVLGLVLPMLIERGISHSSDDVRGLCTKQLLGVCKAAGTHIRPHVVTLVPALLETLSVIEDPALNYLQMHSESAGVAEGALEAARVSAMRGSDAMTAIDTCLRVMDAPQLEAALPAVMQLLKGGVGLPTRAGTARFIVQIAQQQPLLLVPHASRLLKSLHSASLHERSEVARGAYAAAAAQVARGATSETLSKLVADLTSRYISDEGGVEDSIRLAIGGLMRELLRVATDAMGRVRSEWIPLLFLGKHEPRTQKEVADAPTAAQREERGKLAALWLEAYDEAGIGPSVLGMHLPEVLPVLNTIVHGPSWALRRAAAYALLEIEDTVPKGMVKEEQGKEMGALAARLVERRWRDKEFGDQAKKIEALAKAHGHAPKENVVEEPAVEPKAVEKDKAGEQGAGDEEADSGDF